MTKPKPGRPAKPRPAKPSRPLAIPGGVTVVTKLDVKTLAKLDRMAVDRLMTRSGLIREMIEKGIK